METAESERRLALRYPLLLDLTCRLIKGRQILRVGKGRTCNISSRGIFFSSREVFETGSTLWLSIRWPAEREGQRIELSVIGRVLRSDSLGTAVQIQKHGFEFSAFPTSRGAALPDSGGVALSGLRAVRSWSRQVCRRSMAQYV